MSSDQVSGDTIAALLMEERRYEPPADFAAQANAQPELYERSFEELWTSEGNERVTWFEIAGGTPARFKVSLEPNTGIWRG